MSSDLTNVTIDGFTIKGKCPSKDAVMHLKDGFVKNWTLSNCILDGEGDTNPDRLGIYG
jgi:hypothetical protein